MKTVLLVVSIVVATLLPHSRLHAWEGDDGGLDQWEVQVGRFAERMNNQMQLTPPPQPPPPPVPVFSGATDGRRCFGAEPLLAWYSPGWDVVRMSRIMWRESNCQPGAYNPSGASGLLQLLKSHCRWLSSRVGPCDLFNPNYNIRAAAVLWREQGYGAWEQTDG